MRKKILIDHSNISDKSILSGIYNSIEIKDVSLHSLDTNIFKSCKYLSLYNVNMDVKRIHNPFLSITYLKIRNQILNLEAISVLFPNLEVLRIEGCKIISNEEKVIFKDIVELELRELTINEFPQFIFKFPNLSHLLIEGENSTKICIPYNLIELKNLRQVGFYNLEVLQFDYPLSEIYIDDFNMFALHMENCTIHDFPKQIINAAENFYFYHNNCEFKSFSSNQLKVFYDRFPIGLD